VRDVQRRAERRAGVAAAGWTQIALERPVAPQARVRHAVERHAAGHHEVAVARARVQPAREVEQHLLQAPLHRRGERGVAGVNSASGPAPARSAEVDVSDDEAARAVVRAPARGTRPGTRAPRRTPSP
jgi:hypothetical protein